MSPFSPGRQQRESENEIDLFTTQESVGLAINTVR